MYFWNGWVEEAKPNDIKVIFELQKKNTPRCIAKGGFQTTFEEILIQENKRVKNQDIVYLVVQRTPKSQLRIVSDFRYYAINRIFSTNTLNFS